MTAQIIPFNPLDKKNLGASVAEAMLAQPVTPLGEVPDFFGAGIYAIYYTGKFQAYEAIAKANRDGRFIAPIYVGKAVPAGARKGVPLNIVSRTRALCSRLREHAESVKAARNLDIADFYCRFLVVDDIWIPLGESLLIAKFSPVWNTIIDGFGNHDPGAGRYKGMRPRWDVLHPGRGWAEKCQPRKEKATDIARDVETYLRNVSCQIDQHLITPGGD
jgi:hypothetical protein